ncbi:DNA repair protein RAD50 isoform X2 [Periplaneta americana]
MDPKGSKLVVTRIMQLTQKLKKLEFKTRDSTLSKVTRTGERADISGRCLDIDLEVSAALGVSKSILNNVIFCHQEDSAWPLDEGKKVKEKFDDIFDATKHNKYLEHIRLKKKTIADDLKLVNNDIEHLEKVNEEVNSKKNELNEATNRMNVNKDQIEKYNNRLKPITERLEMLRQKEGHIQKLITEKEKKKTELQGVQRNEHELEESIETRFQGTTEELNKVIENFNSEMKVKQIERNNLYSKLNQLDKEDKKLQSEITREEVKKGKLQTEVDQHYERIGNRNKRVNRLAENLDIHERISMSSTQMSEEEVSSLMNKVNKKMEEMNAAFKALTSQLEAEEQEVQNKVDGYRDEKVSLEQQMSMKTKQIATNKQEIKRIKEEIAEADMSQSKLVRIEARLKRAVQDLEQVEKSINVNELKEEIKSNMNNCKRLEEDLDIVDKEVMRLQQQSSLQTELDVQRERKSIKESEIRKLKSKNEDTLQHLLKTIPEQGIKYELKLCMDRLTDDIKDMSNKLNSKQRELTTLEANRKHLKDALKKQEEDLRTKEEELYDYCEDKDYEEVVARSRDTVQELQDQKGTLSSSEYMFRRYIQKLQQPEPCCPLCHRGFDLEADVKELISELNMKVREVPSRLRDNEKKLEIERKKCDKLLELKTTHTSISTLKDSEIPKLRTELQQMEKRIAQLRGEVEQLESSLFEPQADKEMAEKVQPDVVLLDQHYADLQKTQKEIERLEARLPAGNSSRSMQEALNDQEKLKSEVNGIRRTLEELQHKLTNHTDRVQRLKEEKNQLTEEQLKIKGAEKQREQLEEKQLELQGLEAVLNDEVDKLRESLAKSKKNLETAVKEKDSKKQENKEKIAKEQTQITEYLKQTEEIERYESNIKEFKKRGVENKLDEITQSLLDLKTIKDTTTNSIRDLSAKIGNLDSELSKQKTKERDLLDNLKLRKKGEEAEVLKDEIKELESKLGNLNHENFWTEKTQLQKEEEAINTEKAQSEGRLNEQKRIIVTLQQDLKKPMFRNAQQEYLEKVLRKKVQEAAASDLNCYYQATEWAMFHFHKEKMKEINTIIRELWRQIYRGNDIDYIEIKTDVPENSTIDKRRSYNYRVVQMKNDVEIDMRGRCSAGQKVLASLIIRMALAETFSANCGMLALDEPTTNLDRENIESLSTALADIVNTRMVQKNFQLVIITHDEEFLDRLSKVEKLEVYYRVSRNEYGKSVIEKHRVDR